MKKFFLVIQHTPHEGPGLLGAALEARGAQLRVVKVYEGARLPKVGAVRGVVSLGGPMSSNDEREHAWIRPEIEFLRDCVEGGVRVAGICLGAQLLARALGVRVAKNPVHEMGWLPIRLTDAGKTDPVLSAAGPEPTVFHWHGETFELAPEAVLLASSKACAHQAYRVGENAYGLQFHPEVDLEMISAWLASDGLPADQHLVLAERYQESSRAISSALAAFMMRHVS